ncbi:MAG: hypothetical protein ACP5FN_00600 [Candidatus Micrarchaeia archaeon]
MRLLAYVAFAALLLIISSSHAYFNVTYLNTTVILQKNTSAHVIEVITLYISNSSLTQYEQDRQAINLTLSDWQNALGTNLLFEHILNPQASISKFTFLPGPAVRYGNSGTALLTMNYYVNNVTTVSNIAPRKFEYVFNSKVLNFMHTASGVALYPNSRLNIIIPSGSQVVSIYPAPDYPPPSFFGNYTGITTFSWFSEEPLTKFSFSYIVTESLEDEVSNYFAGIFKNYSLELYVLVFAAVALIVIYLYMKVIRVIE